MPPRKLPPRGTALTGQETLVLLGQARGLTRPQIAAEMGLSENSVCTYERLLFARLGAHSAAQAVNTALRRRRIAPESEGPAVRALSRAEIRLLPLVAAGLSNAQIAERAFLSGDTVKTHLRNMFAAVGARSRAHLVKRAYDLGLLHAAPAHPSRAAAVAPGTGAAPAQAAPPPAGRTPPRRGPGAAAPAPVRQAAVQGAAS